MEGPREGQPLRAALRPALPFAFVSPLPFLSLLWSLPLLSSLPSLPFPLAPSYPLAALAGGVRGIVCLY
jgi:hypothetical protein